MQDKTPFLTKRTNRFLALGGKEKMEVPLLRLSQ